MIEWKELAWELEQEKKKQQKTNKKLPTKQNKKETWTLDIDLDYFTTRNPESGDVPEHLMNAICDAAFEFENHEKQIWYCLCVSCYP